MHLSNIFLFGAGHVAQATAALLASRRLGTIVLHDLVPDLGAGLALDLNQALAGVGIDPLATGSHDIKNLEGSDIVLITAGFPRQAGMSRLDLLEKNLPVMDAAGEAIATIAPQARVLVVTNPVDVLTWHLKNRHPELNVFGLGCALDTLRFRHFLADELQVSSNSVCGLVIGAHGPHMLPLVNHATAGGIAVHSLLPENRLEEIVRRTREGGTALVQLLKQRSPWNAASTVIADVIESLVFDRRTIHPLSIVCRGDYGFSDIPLALPCIVGADGVAEVLSVDLNDREHEGLNTCAEAMRGVVHQLLA